MPNGTYMANSFFDIFTEVSLDGGQTWSPSRRPLTMMTRAPSAIEAWRMRYFGITLNTGNAADMEDPDHDGIPNIIEFATHSNPLQPNPSPGTPDISGNQLVFTYPRAKEAIGAVTVVVEWSTTLETGSWQIATQEFVLTDDGIVQTVQVTIPAVSGGKCFARLHVIP